jgi:hypothetical protein
MPRVATLSAAQPGEGERRMGDMEHDPQPQQALPIRQGTGCAGDGIGRSPSAQWAGGGVTSGAEQRGEVVVDTLNCAIDPHAGCCQWDSLNPIDSTVLHWY